MGSNKGIITTADWIKSVSLIHNNKYTYEKAVYTRSKDKITITCKIHGDFEQEANSHKRGSGCPYCSNNQRSSTEIFIEKAKTVHQERYDYSLVDYKGADKYIKVICRNHGEFLVTPHNHLTGYNCPSCKSSKMAELLSKTTEQFIFEAKALHNNLYNYDKTEYIKALEKVIIICPIHGDFLQTPNKHLQGQGCPICNNSKGEILIFNWLKENNIAFKPQFELITPEIARNTNLMRIDFFVKHNNKQYFIEYDGIQHFEYVPYFHKGGIIDLEKQQRRDKVLEDFCELHKDKVTLIRFNYTQNKEEIINMLFNIFLN